jgi:hypothetical protein
LGWLGFLSDFDDRKSVATIGSRLQRLGFRGWTLDLECHRGPTSFEIRPLAAIAGLSNRCAGKSLLEDDRWLVMVTSGFWTLNGDSVAASGQRSAIDFNGVICFGLPKKKLTARLRQRATLPTY